MMNRFLQSFLIVVNICIVKCNTNEVLAKFQRCYDLGEAFSGSYLTTTEHLLNLNLKYENLSFANPERAFHVSIDATLVPSSFGENEQKRTGVIIQSIDLLDFSIVELSKYARLHKVRRRYHLPEMFKAVAFDVLSNATKLIRTSPSSLNSSLKYNMLLGDTVVVMPWMASVKSPAFELGKKNVSLTRIRFKRGSLAACFWSMYSMFANIVVFVMNKIDYDFVRLKSGLPFTEVVFVPQLPHPGALPLAAIIATQNRLATGAWQYRHVLYTESDQILLFRPSAVTPLYEFLSSQPRYVMVPHRLIPYPKEIFEAHLHRVPPPDTISTTHWMNMSCCMPRQVCTERDSWVHVRNESVPFLDFLGFKLALGNVDYHKEKYRACSGITAVVEVCP